MKEIRCKACNKLLGMFDGTGEIKCSRVNCGKINRFDTKKNTLEIVKPKVGTPMRERTTSSGVTFKEL